MSSLTAKKAKDNVIYSDFSKKRNTFSYKDGNYSDYQEAIQEVGKEVKNKISVESNEIKQLVKMELANQIKDFGMDLKEYLVSNFNDSQKNEYTKAEKTMEFTKFQRCVVSKLSADTNVSLVYSHITNGIENFLIVIDNDDPDFIMNISDIYWDVYDELQEIDEEYSFNFEPVTYEEFMELDECVSLQKIFYKDSV
ncbi:TPA: hypothetical protein ACIQN7_005779 [Bacillus cereus]